MSDYPYRSALFVPAALRAAANATAPTITGNPVDAANTYSVALSPTGEAPATHYACCTAVNSSMLSAMQATLEAGVLPGVMFYRWDLEDRLLVSTSSPNASAIVGTRWGWPQSLADAGLAVIFPTMPG